MKNRGNIITIILLFLFCIVFNAQALQFKSSVNRTKLGLSEQLIYTITIVSSQEISQPQIIRPDFKHFTLIRQTGPSTKSSISIVQGVRTQSFERTFTFVLLPEKTGHFEIPSAMMILDNQKFTTQSYKIEVVENPVETPDYFIKTEISKTEAYIDEIIIYTIKLYYIKNIDRIEIVQMPEFSNFISENLIQNRDDVNYHTQIYNGISYNVQDITRLALFPLNSGHFEIQKPIVRALIGDGFFRRQESHILRENNSLSINVLPLPSENRPDNFSGSVGNINISMHISDYKEKIKIGESINISVLISGKGNVKSIRQPLLKNSDWLRIYEPTVTENQEIKNNELYFEKEYKYIIVPVKKGNFPLGPFKYIFFNPESKKYETMETEHKFFSVEEGDKEIIEQLTFLTTPDQIQENIHLQDSLKFIKNDLSYINNYSYLINNFYFKFVFVILILSYFTFIIIKKYYYSKSNNYVIIRRKKALKTANKILNKSLQFLTNKKYNEYAQEISKAIYSYIGDKFSLPAKGLTTNKINELLYDLNVDKEIIKEITALVEKCDMIRFSPAAFSEEKMYDLYDIGIKTIVDVEKYLN